MSYHSLHTIGMFRAFVFSSQFPHLRLCLCSSVQLSAPRAELQAPTEGTPEERGLSALRLGTGTEPWLLWLCLPALALPRPSGSPRAALENRPRRQRCGERMRALERAKGDEASQGHVAWRGLCCQPGCAAKGLGREEEAEGAFSVK